MGCCFSEPVICGQEDEGAEGVFVLKVKLSTGYVARVYVRPSDTIKDVKKKIESVHGRQPDVAYQGQSVPTFLLLRKPDDWYSLDWDMPVHVSGITATSEVKFADITDQLERIKRLTNAHWAVSNAAYFVAGQANGGFLS
eukprot:CAMPEP_0198316472 /NCGR_PEP_ID=MMETSP1450-20131203/6354_1 /TAXON_ID=753684 ORGANISM="Madagascaria erythrocladiodes, Strain CCMP3234" /NCGR_SAMPLE_ID=MMETSP1450 /ASSEMBLY_ACC=CAM_ASM_001115 /LENGTH=139 /DNA_ID=CAMNT_0044019631 /DNA_START=42 /DNA_END=461 /DNA_ORIENTATION=+